MIELANSRSPRQRLYFGLGTLLLFVAACAAIFGCFRFGYDRGLASGRERWLDEATHPLVYNVGDINRAPDGEADFDTLINTMTTEIEETSWDAVGGQGTISPVNRDQLLIGQTKHVHEQIRDFLQSIRDGRRVLKTGNGK
jgi:hypothetical protein